MQNVKWFSTASKFNPWYYRVIRRNQWPKLYPSPGNLLAENDASRVNWTVKDMYL